MLISLSKYIDYLEECVYRHDIYVLGGQGETVCDLLPKIPKMESGDYLVNVMKTLSERLREGYDPTVMRCYDCSGLHMDYLIKNEVFKYDMTANDLYNKMKPVKMGDIKAGDYVFQEGTKRDSKGNTIKYMHHVGMYIGNGKVIESKGRLYGVVKTDLHGDYTWTHAARPDWWIYDNDKPFALTRKLKYVKNDMMRGDDVTAVQTALVGHKVMNDYEIDGVFGPATKEAVTKFQELYSVAKPKKAGVVGKTTALALGLGWEV